MGGKVVSSRLSAMVLKALGVFGTAEGLAMLCGLVRTKLVALWVGAAGVGLFGLFNSVVEMIGALTQSGLRNSAVRQIASRHDGPGRQVSIFVGRRLALVLGLLLGVLCACLSPVLSYMSFGDNSYWWGFCWLGVCILFNSLTAMESGVLQGVNRLAAIAKASVSGSLVALFVSVPMLYVWRIDGVVPVILAYSVSMFVCYWWQRYRTRFDTSDANHSEYIGSSKDMLRFGLYLTASGFVVWVVNYILMSYVNNHGGGQQLGYFQCGYTVVVKYMGVVFSAIGMEFFPRLSQAMGRGAKRVSVFVNHEIYVMLCVVVGLSCVLAALAPVVVRLLYSSEFLPAVPYIMLAMLGCVGRCVSWCMGYMVVAKGDGHVYMAMETASGLLCLGLSIAGYHLMGLSGLGWAFAVWYLLYAVIVYMVVRCRYGYRMSSATAWWVALSMVLISLTVWLAAAVSVWMSLLTAAIGLVVCLWMLKR